MIFHQPKGLDLAAFHEWQLIFDCKYLKAIQVHIVQVISLSNRGEDESFKPNI